MIQNKKFEYLEWRSLDQMHFDSVEWLSELNFIADELLFLEDLLKEYFIQLSSKQQYPKAKSLVDALTESKDKVKELIVQVQRHNNDLSVLTDNEDQPYEEREVKAAHREMLTETNNYFQKFKALKKNIFILVSNIMKHDRAKRLLN